MQSEETTTTRLRWRPTPFVERQDLAASSWSSPTAGDAAAETPQCASSPSRSSSVYHLNASPPLRLRLRFHCGGHIVYLIGFLQPSGGAQTLPLRAGRTKLGKSSNRFMARCCKLVACRRNISPVSCPRGDQLLVCRFDGRERQHRRRHIACLAVERLLHDLC